MKLYRFGVGEEVRVTPNAMWKDVAGQLGVIRDRSITREQGIVYVVDIPGRRPMALRQGMLFKAEASCVFCAGKTTDTSLWSELAEGDVCPICAMVHEEEVREFRSNRYMHEDYRLASLFGRNMGD
jgi:hypothetical protein